MKTAIRMALACALFCPDASACTIVAGVDQDGVAWAENNEDMYFHFDTSLKVLPRGEGRLGAVVVTYSDGFPQGGVNEKGLFYDFNALRPVPRENYLDWDAKIDPPEGVNIIGEMLQRFDNVPDAIAVARCVPDHDLARKSVFGRDSLEPFQRLPGCRKIPLVDRLAKSELAQESRLYEQELTSAGIRVSSAQFPALELTGRGRIVDHRGVNMLAQQ